MKLVQDKPAESFRRFYLFSLRLSALLGVSLLRSLLSLRYSFSTIRLDLLYPLTRSSLSQPPLFSLLLFFFLRI